MAEDEKRTLREEKVCRKNHLGKLFLLLYLAYLCPRFRGIALLSNHIKERNRQTVRLPKQCFNENLKPLIFNKKEETYLFTSAERMTQASCRANTFETLTEQMLLGKNIVS